MLTSLRSAKIVWRELQLCPCASEKRDVGCRHITSYNTSRWSERVKQQQEKNVCMTHIRWGEIDTMPLTTSTSTGRMLDNSFAFCYMRSRLSSVTPQLARLSHFRRFFLVFLCCWRRIVCVSVCLYASPHFMYCTCSISFSIIQRNTRIHFDVMRSRITPKKHNAKCELWKWPKLPFERQKEMRPKNRRKTNGITSK